MTPSAGTRVVSISAMSWRVPHRTTVVAAGVVAAGLVAVACGTTDSASRETLPPIVTTTSSTLPPTTPPELAERIFYTIKRGDTLQQIANSFSVTVQSIIDLNGITNPDSIAAGQTVEIPTGLLVIEELPDPPAEPTADTTG